MAVQHRQQHGQPLRIKPDGQPARIAVRGIDQRLDFDEQRPRAFLRHHHAGSGHVLPMLRQKKRRRIADAFEAGFRHGKDADFIDRTKAVLDGPHEAEARMRVTLEIEHGVDDVLEHARPGQGALLCHVTDENDRDAGLLGQPCQLRRAFAHLGDRPRRTGKLVGP